MEHHHRPTTSKQNKPFKSKHATKGQLNKSKKGKVEKLSNKSLKKISTEKKVDRKNAAKVLQQKKRFELVNKNRIFKQAPKIIVKKNYLLVPLCDDVDSEKFVNKILKFTQSSSTSNEFVNIETIKLERFNNQQVQFIPLKRNLLDILDAIKVADFCLFLLSANNEVDSFGDLIIKSIKGQGVPSIVSAIEHLNTNLQKNHTLIKKSLQTYLEFHFAGEQKLFTIDQEQDCWAALRYITSQTPKVIAWRDNHSYLLAEKVEFHSSVETEDVGSLKFTGYIRGKNLSANSLVHIQGYGDFQIEKISSANAPLKNKTNTLILEEKILAVPDKEKQESLLRENEPDEMDGEQTWPTEEELLEAEERVKLLSQGKKRKVLVPKGTSSYQASWIYNSDDESVGEDEEGDVEMGDKEISNEVFNNSDDEKEFVDIDADEVLEGESNSRDDEINEELDLEEEKEQYENYLKARKKKFEEAQEDLEFPDEIDTPMDIPAKVRFARYRGLKSFRTSPWDPYENLPIDYSRIFQFKNFSQTRKKILKEIQNQEEFDEEEDEDSKLKNSIDVGFYCQIYIKNFTKAGFENLKSNKFQPKLIFSLLPHEQKMSVLNFSITRPSLSAIAEELAIGASKDEEIFSMLENSSTKKSLNNVPNLVVNSGSLKDAQNNISIKLKDFKLPLEYVVKSKDEVLICSGFRRYLCRPIYSSNTRNGSNNVHKFERFLQPGNTMTGSVYLPIHFSPNPITVFKLPNAEEAKTSNKPIFIGTGSVLTNDPSRIVTKRIILTGHPFKVHKRSATIRYMFHDPADVDWFKPVQLFTKFGKKGHIKESLGTHGYMKCLFDVQLKQQDTVCMYLYKRVFPKWNSELFLEGKDCARNVFEGSCIDKETEMELD
ncbi:hypothetical protein HDU92_006442 [Lobulomyces angularis]|nr:hypothetical protein HDU92_006442 [Lobulomyces angularis]